MGKTKLNVSEKKSSLAQTAGATIPVINLKLADVIDHDKFFSVLKEVEKNIENKLTDPDKARVITIKIIAEPDDKRSGAAFSCMIDFKPCPIRGGKSTFGQFGETLPFKK